MWPKDLMPKVWTVVLRAKKYTGEPYGKKMFARDLAAGTVVGIVALPLAIAFAIASGVKPEQGLYTAVVAGFLISLLSGSRFQIGGPTGAFVVIVYGVVQKYGYDGLAVATMMAGIFLVIMGLARLGSVIKYITHPVTVGFTSGIALIIFSSQVKDLLGLPLGDLPVHFIAKWEALGGQLVHASPYAAAIGVGTAVFVFWWPKITTKVPGAFLAVVATTAIVKIFNLPVDTIGSTISKKVRAGLAPRS